MRKVIAILTSLVIVLTGVVSAFASAHQVARIQDGDTLTTVSGEKIRFLQIDTPEISPAECFGVEAHKALISLIGKNQITLESDAISADQDQFGRSLRYVNVGKMNVNLRLVEIGAATPFFYKGEKGKYSSKLLKAARNAKAKKIGLWKACPNTKLEPLKPATTGLVKVSNSLITKSTSNAKCDINYQGCIPAYPPDLDCVDIKRMDLAPVRVIAFDVHKLDGDGDGVGCDK